MKHIYRGTISIILLGIMPLHTSSFNEGKSLLTIVDAFEKSWQDNKQKKENLQKFAILLENAQSKVDTNKTYIITLFENEVAKRIQKYSDQIDMPMQISYPETIQTRLQRHNAVREEPLILNEKLMETAQERAEYLAKNTIAAGNVHRRNTNDRYYDYTKIEQWFKNRNIIFANNSGSTFSESVAYNYVKYWDDNCDQLLWEATKKSRKFLYEDEKNGWWAHYRAITQQNFQNIGIGIAINKDIKRYYIVLHYGTEIESKE